MTSEPSTPDQPFVEREWKWEIPSSAAYEGLQGLTPPAGYRLEAWRQSRLLNQYFDTQRGELSERRAALRLRSQVGCGQILTLKEKHVREGALHTMREWEARVDSFDSTLPWQSASPPSRRLVELVGKQPLYPLTQFETLRWWTAILGPAGRVVMVALDHIRWLDGESFRELELELVSAEPLAPWTRWIEDLAAHWCLRISNQTKLQRALAQEGR